MRQDRATAKRAKGDLARLLWLWCTEPTFDLRECSKRRLINKVIVKKLMSNLVRAFPSDPGKKNLRQELQESCDNEKTPFSE